MRTGRLLPLIIIICFLFSLIIPVQSYFYNQHNKNVELVLDLEQTKQLANTTEKPLGYALERFKKAGITTVAVKERTLSSLAGEGKIEVFTSENVLFNYRLLGKNNYRQRIAQLLAETNSVLIYSADSELIKQINNTLYLKLGQKVKLTKDPNNHYLLVNANIHNLLNIGLGFNRADFSLIAASGLHIIPRLQNDSYLNAQIIEDSFAKLSLSTDFDKVMFSGKAVYGYPDSITHTAEQFTKYKLTPGIIEFGGQAGIKQLVSALDYQGVLVHSIAQGESFQEIKVAVRDRGARLLYINPASINGEFDQKLRFIEQIRDNLSSWGYTLAATKAITPSYSKFPVIVSIIGVIGGALLLLNNFFFIGKRYNIIIFSLLVLFVLVAGTITGHISLLQIIALCAAIVFPSLAVITQWKGWRKLKEENPHLQRFNRNVLGSLFRATLISLVGATFVFVLLSGPSFLIRIDVFRGVKIAHLLPIFIVLLYISKGLLPRVKQVKIKKIPVKYLFIFVICILIGYIYIGRTGNTAGIPFLNIEQLFRDFLNENLVARPRTKEFLFGHPAFILALFLLMRGSSNLAALFATLATVGQISIVNTFAHTYTPYTISLLRVTNGLVIGGIIGILAINVINIRWLKNILLALKKKLAK